MLMDFIRVHAVRRLCLTTNFGHVFQDHFLSMLFEFLALSGGMAKWVCQDSMRGTIQLCLPYSELLQPFRQTFFTQALLTVQSVELAVTTPVGIGAVLVEQYNQIVLGLARRSFVVTIKAHTEYLDGGEMRLRVTVTLQENEWAVKIVLQHW